MTDTSPAAPPDPDAEFDELRQAILAAALPNVPFDGWTMAALKTATSDAGYAPDEALRAFPGGPREAVEAYLQMADARMLESLAAVDVDSLKIRERIAKAVRTRLENAAAERVTVLPPRAAEGAGNGNGNLLGRQAQLLDAHFLAFSRMASRAQKIFVKAII